MGLNTPLLDLRQHGVPSEEIPIDLVVHASFLMLTEDQALKHLITRHELDAVREARAFVVGL